MYFLIFHGCSKIAPFIVSVKSTREKIFEGIGDGIAEKITFWNKNQIKENTGIDIEEDFNFQWETKFISMGKVTDLDYFKSLYFDLNKTEPCICFPILASVFYNEKGDAFTVLKELNDFWY